MTGSPRRKPVSRPTRRGVWLRYGARCGLCSQPIPREFHHILPVSDGGDDNAANLMPLCSNCHTGVAHRLYSISQRQTIIAAGKRVQALAALEHYVLQTQAWAPRARRLLTPSVRTATLLNGMYGQVEQLARVIEADAEPEGEDEQDLYAQLVITRSEMAYYRRASPQVLDDLENVGPLVVGLGKESTSDAYKLAKVRLLRQLSSVGAEQEILESIAPGGEYEADRQFRLLSLSLYTSGQFSAPADAAVSSTAMLPDLLTEVAELNIAGDRARLREQQGEFQTAYRGLVDVFRNAHNLLFRRNMHATGLSLARLALRLGDPGVAAEWVAVAARFAASGVAATHTVDEVRLEIVRVGGEGILNVRAPDAARLEELMTAS